MTEIYFIDRLYFLQVQKIILQVQVRKFDRYEMIFTSTGKIFTSTKLGKISLTEYILSELDLSIYIPNTSAYSALLVT